MEGRVGSAEDKKVRGRYLLLNTLGMHLLVFYFCCPFSLVRLFPLQGPIEGQPTTHALSPTNTQPRVSLVVCPQPSHRDGRSLWHARRRDARHNLFLIAHLSAVSRSKAPSSQTVEAEQSQVGTPFPLFLYFPTLSFTVTYKVLLF